MKKNYFISTVIWAISLCIFSYLLSGIAEPMPYSIGFGLFGTLVIALIINMVSYIRTWMRDERQVSGYEVFLRCMFFLLNIICLIPLLIMTIFLGMCL